MSVFVDVSVTELLMMLPQTVLPPRSTAYVGRRAFDGTDRVRPHRTISVVVQDTTRGRDVEADVAQQVVGVVGN
ncbi:MAG: hypothetical protein AAGA65_29445 [Actinomycetota bacterium]